MKPERAVVNVAQMQMDFAKMEMELIKHLVKQGKAKAIFQLHDEHVLEVHENDVDEVVRSIRKAVNFSTIYGVRHV